MSAPTLGLSFSSFRGRLGGRGRCMADYAQCELPRHDE